MIEIYTDGGCRKNGTAGAPAAWAFAVYVDGVYKGKKAGIVPNGTNNLGELEAVIQALDWCSRHADEHTSIHCDSMYVINGCTTWIHKWIRNDWLTASKEPVKNLGSWKRIELLLEKVPTSLRFMKVKAHVGIEGNEKADQLCNEQLDIWERENG